LAGWVADRVREAAGSVRLIGGGSLYHHLGIETLDEAFPGKGPLSGIEAALRLGCAEQNLIVACDMPGIRTEWLQALLAFAGTVDARAVAPCAPGKSPEPLCAVYHARCLPVVQRMLAEGELRASILLDRVDSVRMEVGWAASLSNVNTPLDWAEIQSWGRLAAE
jgi:molybdopterin-guanine dinucleotide biosynthesis protein A